MSHSIWSKISTWLAFTGIMVAWFAIIAGSKGLALCGLWAFMVFGLVSFLRWTEMGRGMLSGISFPEITLPSLALPAVNFPAMQMPSFSRSSTSSVAGAYTQPSARTSSGKSWLPAVPNLSITIWCMILSAILSIGMMLRGDILMGLGFIAVFWVAVILHFKKGEQILRWLKAEILPLAVKHWDVLWIALSLIGLGGWYIQYYHFTASPWWFNFWVCSAILAVLAKLIKWNLKVVVKAAFGGYGLGWALAIFTVLCVLFYLGVKISGRSTMDPIANTALETSFVTAMFAVVLIRGRKIGKGAKKK